MGSDDELVLLLERAAGPEPGPGDGGDVRRRARRHVRRRRGMAVVAVTAVLVPGLFALDRLRPDDPEVVTSEPAGQQRPLVLLFERELADGSTLRVSTRDDPDDPQRIVVDWPGSPDAPVTLALGQGVTGTVTGDEWTIEAMRPCPGDDATRLRAFATAEPDIADEMELVDGLAVVVVPPAVAPEEVLEPDTHEVTVQTLDAGGGLLSTVGITADVVAPDAADEEARVDRAAAEAAGDVGGGDVGGGGSGGAGGQVQVGTSPCERTP